MKAVKAHLAATNPDRIPIFEKNAATFAKKCVHPLLRCSARQLTRTFAGFSETSRTTSSTPESR